MPKTPLFERPPYLNCPKCMKRAFGALSVDSSILTRRCYECGFKKRHNLPTPDKKVIYLDQNLFSLLFKYERDATLQRGHEEFTRSVYEKLTKLVRCQLLLTPSSDIHLDETIVFREPDLLRAAIEMLGGRARFHDVRYVETLQMNVAAHAFFQSCDAHYTDDVDEILVGKRNDWLPLVHISGQPNYSMFAEELRKNRQIGHKEMQKLFDRWAQSSLSFDDALDSELSSTAAAKLGMLRDFAAGYYPAFLDEDAFSFLSHIDNPVVREYTTVKNIAMSYGYDDGEANQCVVDYWNSEQARSLPTHRISSYLFACLARRAANGMNRNKMTCGILNDVRAISTYAHYVDAMFVDKECANMLAEGPLDRELVYKAKVFSFADPDAFLKYLIEIESEAKPEVVEAAKLVYG